MVNKLRQEGLPAEIYVHEPRFRANYRNIIPRLGLADIEAAIKHAEVIAVDIVANNNKTYRDLVFLNKFGLSPNSLDLFGEFADKMRRPPYSKLVIGPGQEFAECELNRVKGMELARKAGLTIPPYIEFKSLKVGAKFLASKEGKAKKWFFKGHGNLPDDLTYGDTFEGELLDLMTHKIPERLGKDNVDFILQESVTNDDGTPGVECSNEIFMAGGKAMVPNRTLENKPLHWRKSGPRVGCAVSTVWLCDDAEGPVHKEMQKLLPMFKDLYCPLDFNVIFTKDGRANYLEPSGRFGYSAFYLLLFFILPGKMANFFLNPFHTIFKEGFVASQVVSLDPYPREDRKLLDDKITNNLIAEDINDKSVWWVDVYQDAFGNLRCGGGHGLVGVVTAHGDSIEDAVAKAYQKADSLKITGDKQFWPLNEHLEDHTERYKKLQKWGII